MLGGSATAHESTAACVTSRLASHASASRRPSGAMRGADAARRLARLARVPRRAPLPPLAAAQQPARGAAGGGGVGGAPGPEPRLGPRAGGDVARFDPRTAAGFASRAAAPPGAERMTAAAPTRPAPDPGAPLAASDAARVPRPGPADASGPSLELWGPDETSGSFPGSSPPPAPPTARVAPEAGACLVGEIRRVTFHNPDNGYTVARVRVANSHLDALPIGATATRTGRPAYKQRKAKKGKTKEAIVTVVGHVPSAAEGQNLRMSGDWRDVEKWGTQFVLNATPAEVPPEDEDAMLRYLAGGVLPGVGKVTAGKLVAHFGAGVFEALDRADAEAALRECPGVGAKTAAKLKRAWDHSRGRRDATAFLEKHGIAPALAQRVAAAHGAATESRVRADPFGALAGVRGATFHRCDALAARLGKAPDDRARLAAAMLQTLQSEARSDGHSYLSFERLTEGVARVVGPRQAAALPPGALEKAADLLLERGDIVRADLGASGASGASGTTWASSGVFASVLHDAEASVAADIARRLHQPRRVPDVPRVRRWLQAAATKEGWRLLSPAQEAFLDLALREPISVLTGGPGTGKTFATHIAVRLWRAMGRKVLMCAPTGRAAQRLAEIATAGRRMSQPVQSSTIHRLLETRRGKGAAGDGDDDDDVAADEYLSYKGAFARDAASPLDADVVVVDESSMLDLPLCAALLDAVKPDAQLVFVGDADQLPSVGPGSVLRDILASGAVPAVQLRDVFRQAERSGIVRAAHAINAGHLPAVPTRRWDPSTFALAPEGSRAAGAGAAPTMPSSNPARDAEAPGARAEFVGETWDGADCVWVTLPDDSPAGYEGVLEALMSGALPALADVDPASDLQVLTPFRRGPASTSQLNAYLQARLNPPGNGRLETRFGDVTFREGDRVLQQRNDYQKEVFNGDLGTVVAVDGDGSVRVVFGGSYKPSDGEDEGATAAGGDIPRGDTIARAVASGGREVSYSRAELRDLIPAWALTVHKAQGSEYRAVVLCLASNHRPLLRRELVYTAVSRAKEVLVVLAPPPALETAVASVGNDRRCTMLARRLAPLAPDAPSCPAQAAIAAAADERSRRTEV